MNTTTLTLFIKKLGAALSVVVAVFVLWGTSAALAQVNIKLGVEGCNNNNMCEANLGETVYNCPNDCTGQVPPDSGGGDSSPSGSSTGTSSNYRIIYFSRLRVIPTTNSVTISWFTNRITAGTIILGKTLDYELGSVSEINYTNTHSVKIENLEPGTQYFFKIDAQDTLKNVATIVGNHFTTLQTPDAEPPANVSGLVLVPKNDALQLQWKNPLDDDFDGIRITRSTSFFPKDPYEGKIVYEGKGTYVTDIDVEPGVTYYYAVFSHDVRDNFSSGALARGRVLAVVGEDAPISLSSGVPETATSTLPLEELPVITTTDPLINDLTLMDFDFIEKGKKITLNHTFVPVDGGVITVAIDQAKLPTYFRTLAIVVEDPSHRKSNFLLRSNSEKTAYEATFGVLERKGTYDFDIVMLDHKQQMLKKLSGKFVVLTDYKPPPGPVSKVQENLIFILFIFILLLILVTLSRFIAFERKKHHEEVKVEVVEGIVGEVPQVPMVADTTKEEAKS